MRNRKTVNESSYDVDLFIRTHSMKQVGRHKELDRKFAKELASALEQFANKKKMTPDEVMAGGDDLMSEFANWAKKNLRMDIDKYMPSAEEFVEESGSRMDEFDILNWIYEEMRDCEWAEIDASDISDDKAELEVALPGADGDVFRVSVQKIWSGRLGEKLD